MKVIVSIDIKSIMSIDTINVVYIDMKKRNLREGYPLALDRALGSLIREKSATV